MTLSRRLKTNWHKFKLTAISLRNWFLKGIIARLIFKIVAGNLMYMESNMCGLIVTFLLSELMGVLCTTLQEDKPDQDKGGTNDDGIQIRNVIDESSDDQ